MAVAVEKALVYDRADVLVLLGMTMAACGAQLERSGMCLPVIGGTKFAALAGIWVVMEHRLRAGARLE